jgi:Ca2+-binding RTX toxin-like protein
MTIFNGDQNTNNLNDEFLGGAADDIINGLKGSDTLGGGGGNDQINGGEGNDHLFGDDREGSIGNDILDGGTGDDSMVGEAGNDTYIVDSSKDQVIEDSDANSGVDLVKSSIPFTLPANVENLTLIGTGKIHGIGNTGNNTIIGNASNNLLRGSGGTDLLNGGEGFDIAEESADSDFLINDTNITFTGGVDSLVNMEAVQIFGGAGNNIINAARFTGRAFLAGLEGSDFITGGSGNDTLVGDTFFIGQGLADDTLNGGAGLDTIRASANTSLTLTNTRLTGAGNDTLISIEKAELTGGTGNTTIDATAFSGSVEISDEFGGNDVLLGAKGNDVIDGGDNSDVVAGGAGNDSLFGGFAEPKDFSGALDKFVYNTGNAFRASDVGVDTLGDFAAGIDKIVLDKRTFTSISSNVGDGFSQSGEFKVVTSDSAAQTSSADIVYNSANGKLFYNQNGTSSGFGSGAQFATLTGKPALKATDFILQSSSALGLTGKPIAQGSSSNNTIVGQAVGGILNGLAGNDKLLGKGGDDILLGGVGDDKLNGGTDDDLLDGGAGADQLIGGAGADIFIFAKGAGIDLVRDFKVGVDRIGFKSEVLDIRFVAGQGGTVVKSGDESLAILQGIKPAQLSLNDVVRIGRTQISGMSVPTIWN